MKQTSLKSLGLFRCLNCIFWSTQNKNKDEGNCDLDNLPTFYDDECKKFKPNKKTRNYLDIFKKKKEIFILNLVYNFDFVDSDSVYNKFVNWTKAEKKDLLPKEKFIKYWEKSIGYQFVKVKLGRKEYYFGVMSKRDSEQKKEIKRKISQAQNMSISSLEIDAIMNEIGFRRKMIDKKILWVPHNKKI